jgi:hypothetical protein
MVETKKQQQKLGKIRGIPKTQLGFSLDQKEITNTNSRIVMTSKFIFLDSWQANCDFKGYSAQMNSFSS